MFTPAPLFDNAGLLFNAGGGALVPGGAEVNIASDGDGGYWLWETTTDASYLPGNGAGYDVSLTITPEPATATMFVAGLALVGLGALKRRRQHQR